MYSRGCCVSMRSRRCAASSFVQAPLVSMYEALRWSAAREAVTRHRVAFTKRLVEEAGYVSNAGDEAQQEALTKSSAAAVGILQEEVAMAGRRLWVTGPPCYLGCRRRAPLSTRRRCLQTPSLEAGGCVVGQLQAAGGCAYCLLPAAIFATNTSSRVCWSFDDLLAGTRPTVRSCSARGGVSWCWWWWWR